MKLLFSIGFCFLTLFASAQKSVVKGVVFDSVQNKPLALASVAVYLASDTSLVTYRLSSPTGEFSVTEIPLQRLCRVVISFQGYKVFRKEFELSKDNPQIDLGIIHLVEDAKALDEILISTERPPMMMRNDTLEFNANAFKTLPSTLVEDLLKKLPGVQVDINGNITVNGRPVNRLLVDGKEFFGADYRIATRNLPANIVDKVQVVDDAEEKKRNPRIQSNRLGQVVNIKLKKAIRQGWFGKVYGGTGTNERHEAGGIVNLFRDTTQISLLGFSNNVNKPGFGTEDLQQVGGNNRGGDFMSEYSIGGIQHSLGGGLNFNNQFGKNLTANFNYVYKQNNSVEESKSYSQQFLEDTTLLSPSSTRREGINKEHKLGGSLRWSIDSVTTLHFRPGLSLGADQYNDNHESVTTDNFKGLVNKNDYRSFSMGKSYRYDHTLSFATSSRKNENRSLNIDLSTSLNNSNGDNFEEGIYTFYASNIGRDSLLNQLRRRENKSFRHSLDINFSQSLANWARFSLHHEAAYERDTNGLYLYNKASSTDRYSVYNDALSNGAKRQGWRHNSTADFSFSYKSWELAPKLNLLWLRNDNFFPKSPTVNQRLFFAYPSLELRWKSFSLSYEADVSPPDPSDLRQIVDIADPLYKRYGNPDLQPAIREQLMLSLFHFIQSSNSSFNFSIGASREKNGFIELTQLDSNRVQISRPVNIDGVKSYSIRGSYNRQFKFGPQLRVALRPNFSSSIEQRFVSVNGFLSKALYKRGDVDLEFSIAYKDIVELNQRYTLHLNQSRYEDKKTYRDAELVTHRLQSAIVVHWPRRVVWESQINYSFNPQVGRGIRTSIVRWNGSLHYGFTKDEKAQLKLSAYDLLNQNVSVYRHNSGGIIFDYQGITLNRYAMLSFVYHIRYFTSGRKSARYSDSEF